MKKNGANNTIDGNLVLIKLVSQNRNIYDRDSKYYHDKLLKKNAWQNIARRLNLEEDFVKIRWKSLREGYVRDIRNSYDAMGNYKSKYKYAKEMSFLMHTIKFRSHNHHHHKKSVSSKQKLEYYNKTFNETNRQSQGDVRSEKEFEITEADLNKDIVNEDDDDTNIFTELPIDSPARTLRSNREFSSSNDELLLVLVNNEASKTCNQEIKSYDTVKPAKSRERMYELDDYDQQMKKPRISHDSKTSSTSDLPGDLVERNGLSSSSSSTSSSSSNSISTLKLQLPQKSLKSASTSISGSAPGSTQLHCQNLHNFTSSHCILRHEDTIFGELVASMMMKITDENEKKQIKKQILNILL